MKDIIEQLQWRYAVKKFDTKRLSEEQVIRLKTAVNLSASSMGLQPYKVLVISDEKTKEMLYPLSYKQSQIVTASHLFLFCAIKSIDLDYTKSYIDLVAQTQEVEVDSLASYSTMVEGFVKNFTEEQKFVWASKQAYIALGTLLTTCAIEGIDACPMEGFSAEEYASALDLDSKGLVPLALCAVGYRSADDKYQFKKKVRKSNLFEI